MDKSTKRVKIICAVLAVLLLAAGCFFGVKNMHEEGTDENTYSLTVYTPHPISFVKPLVEEYERRSGNRIKVVYGSTGALEQELTAGSSIDVMWGGSYYSTIGYKNLFDDYWTPNELYYRQDNKNTEGNLTRFTDMPSVLIVNTDLVGDREIKGYMDLLSEDLKGRIALADPAKSSSSFEQLINIIYACRSMDGIDEWEYISRLCDNLDGNLLKSSQDVYNGVADGKYVVGLTFEEAALGKLDEGKHVKIVYMEEGVVFTPDGVYLLKNAEHRKEAEEFIDFLTGYDAQYMISMQLRRRSVRRDVSEPAGIPAKEELKLLYPVGPEIVNSRDEWLTEFDRLFNEGTTEYGEEDR